MNKEAIIAKIVAALNAELEGHTRSALAALADATDEQNKVEMEINARGLESSYLAQGQSRLAADVREAILQYEALAVRKFVREETIQTGAIVELEREGERLTYFVGPGAGGTEIECEGRTVLVITPHSPMGRQLVGHRQGELLQIEVGGTTDGYRVAVVE